MRLWPALSGGPSRCGAGIRFLKVLHSYGVDPSLAGFHAVVARLRHAPDSIKEIYVEASRRDKRMQTFIEQAERAGCRLHPVGMERLDGGARHPPPGVVALAEERQLAVDVDEVLDVIEGPPLLLIWTA